MKILLLADQCNPEWPSLPVVGYKAALEISKLVEVVLVTHIRNKENLEKVGVGEAEIVYIDTEYIAKPIHNLSKWIRGEEGGWTIAMAFAYPSYLAFEWEVYKLLGKRIKNGEFNLIHRVTPMSPTLPSILACKIDVPFVLGPLNGGLEWPKEYTRERKQEREWLSKFRNAYKFLPYSRKTLKRAKAILASFDHTIKNIPDSEQYKVINFPEVGIDPELFNTTNNQPTNSKVKTILFASRLVPYKLPDIVINAFLSSPILQEHKLIIVGDGPLREEMEARVVEKGLQSQVAFVGWKTQHEVAEYMRESDIFPYPSIRELGAGALVEAMASKMACVVIDYGAPGSLIDDTRGIQIPIQNKDELTKQLTIELEKLVTDSELIKKLANNAYNYVMQHYTWSEKAKKTLLVYDWVLGNKEKPSFF